MEIQCPNCSSRFNLPDKLAKPGVKLRCSVCKNVFAFMPAKKAPASLPDLPVKPKRPFLKVAIALLLLLAGAAGGWWYYTSGESKEKTKSAQEIAKNVELLTMRNVRQYYVDNEKVGKVFVIEGKVVNEFPQPKELMAVEAAIYDKNQQPIVVKKQLCGVQLSLFQLQVLSEKEMESFLNNKIEILTNNTNVPHGGDVPFMVLFYAPPEGVAEFGVRIVDARDVPGQGSKKE
ncbi:MAG: zinc-ribbon domain-containing protein [Desulfovibrio sp.]|nr:zinc-ribbon domain-containing protein [Desulfovibrio sp.]